jgi:phosphatidylserine decarboxylase precursor-related protein
MTGIFALLGQHIDFFPLVALIGLILAGFNLPISEDLVIITGALVCQEAPDLLFLTLPAIFVGVLISDFIVYFLGVLIGRGAVKVKFAEAVLSPKNLQRIDRYLGRHGLLTYIVCRFIPFGVRNVLFMASGFLGLKIRRFALYDIIAATISVNTLFFLTYYFGEGVKNPIKIAGIILFVLLLLTFLALTARFFLKHGIPLTRYGLPQVLVFPGLAAALMAALFFLSRPGLPLYSARAGLPAFWLVPVELLLFIVFAWMLSFFRNPRRDIVQDEAVLLSPADGTVTDISIVEDSALGQKALRIGIFLSLFNVHLNRAPCGVRVETVRYKKGMFRDARSPESTRVNESNDLLMTRLAPPCESLLVRQVSGAVARHIVCRAKETDELRQGELFGMIKFGSRTELYLPAMEAAASPVIEGSPSIEGDAPRSGGTYEIAVKPGDPVRAGITPLIRYT